MFIIAECDHGWRHFQIGTCRISWIQGCVRGALKVWLWDVIRESYIRVTLISWFNRTIRGVFVSTCIFTNGSAGFSAADGRHPPTPSLGHWCPWEFGPGDKVLFCISERDPRRGFISAVGMVLQCLNLAFLSTILCLKKRQSWRSPLRANFLHE